MKKQERNRSCNVLTVRMSLRETHPKLKLITKYRMLTTGVVLILRATPSCLLFYLIMLDSITLIPFLTFSLHVQDKERGIKEDSDKNALFEKNNSEFCEQYIGDMKVREKAVKKKQDNSDSCRLKGATPPSTPCLLRMHYWFLTSTAAAAAIIIMIISIIIIISNTLIFPFSSPFLYSFSLWYFYSRIIVIILCLLSIDMWSSY